MSPGDVHSKIATVLQFNFGAKMLLYWSPRAHRSTKIACDMIPILFGPLVTYVACLFDITLSCRINFHVHV